MTAWMWWVEGGYGQGREPTREQAIEAARRCVADISPLQRRLMWIVLAPAAIRGNPDDPDEVQLGPHERVDLD